MIIRNRYRSYRRFADDGTLVGSGYDASGNVVGYTCADPACILPPGITSSPPSSVTPPPLVSSGATPGAQITGSNPASAFLVPIGSSLGTGVANLFNKLLGRPLVGGAPVQPGIDPMMVAVLAGLGVGGYLLLKKKEA